MKVIAINAGPRKGWNTDQLILSAAKGAEEAGSEVLVCGDTLQVNDYSRYDWTLFDPAAKKQHHDETFGGYLEKACAQGRALCGK